MPIAKPTPDDVDRNTASVVIPSAADASAATILDRRAVRLERTVDSQPGSLTDSTSSLVREIEMTTSASHPRGPTRTRSHNTPGTAVPTGCESSMTSGMASPCTAHTGGKCPKTASSTKTVTSAICTPFRRMLLRGIQVGILGCSLRPRTSVSTGVGCAADPLEVNLRTINSAPNCELSEGVEIAAGPRAPFPSSGSSGSRRSRSTRTTRARDAGRIADTPLPHVDEC